MTPHFCLPARQPARPAAHDPSGHQPPTRRGRRGENPHFSRLSPLSPRRCLRTHTLPAPGPGERGVSPSSRPWQGRREGTARGGHGRHRPLAQRRRRREKAAAAGSFPLVLPSRESSPPPPLPTPAPPAAAASAAAGLRPARPHTAWRLAPASSLTSVPAHAQARPTARPPPDIAAAEGRGGGGGGARRRGHRPPPNRRRRLTCLSAFSPRAAAPHVTRGGVGGPLLGAGGRYPSARAKAGRVPVKVRAPHPGAARV